jgi:long-chain fatty acid transport protein
VALALLLVPWAARAGGFEIAQQGAVAGGTAHAGVARTDDPSAAWFNPAALADDGGLRLGLGITLAAPRIHAEAIPSAPDAPWEATTEASLSTPPQLYLSYAGGRWLMGVSLNVPFGSTMRWSADWPQRFDIISSVSRFFRVAPFVGYRLGPVRIAIGPHFDLGSLDVLKATNHVAEEGQAHFAFDAEGVGGDVSVLLEISDRLALGVSYKSRTRLILTGDADFTVPATFAPGYPDQGIAAEWWLPDRIAIGVAHCGSVVSVFGDASVTLWSVNQTLTLDFEDEVTPDSEVLYGWRDSLAVRLGTDIAVAQRLSLRAGAYVDGIPGAPPPAENLSPSSPDATRIGFTIGAGVRPADPLSIDLFYEHLRLLERASTSADYPQASYRGHAHFLGLSVGIRVPNRSTATR